jgi:hypothetical protein
MSKKDRCNDHKICGKLLVNETVKTPITSACLSVDCLELKTDRMSNKLLHTESAVRYIHHMLVKLEIITFVIKLSRYFSASVHFQ